jgi:ribosomal protein S12 methylthiotransferase accessory factor
MTVALVGEGPAADAVRAALADTDADVERRAATDLEGVGLAVVVGAVDDPAFREANSAAREDETPLLTVELGGLGGHAVDGVEAAVTGFGPGTGCVDCLRTRVAANDPETGDGTVDDATARFAGALAGHEAVRLLATPRRSAGWSNSHTPSVDSSRFRAVTVARTRTDCSVGAPGSGRWTRRSRRRRRPSIPVSAPSRR